MLYFVLYHHPYLETLTKTVIQSRANAFLEKLCSCGEEVQIKHMKYRWGYAVKMSLINHFDRYLKNDTFVLHGLI